MKLIVLAALVVSVTAYSSFRDNIPKAAKNLKGDALRDYVKSLGTTWTAGDAKTPHRQNIMSIKYAKHPEDVEYAAEIKSEKAIPESFDARTQWPACKSIGHIRDQSRCGSCWAVSTSAAFTDRVCIASNGTQNPNFSEEDVLSCCGSFCSNGCDGGLPIRAWQWAIMKGFCTGSGFYENTGCKPYSIEPCGDHTVNGIAHYHDCTNYHPTTPTCSSTCTNRNYNISYPNDKYFAKSAYAVPYLESAIQNEIMTNGPVVAAYLVYDDFYDYERGVYEHVAGDIVGAHAVKVIGWGVDNGTPYWLVANSWNTNFGENGFFRIIRGKNECGFEELVSAGLAKV